jgi:threonine aldolase
MSNAVAVRSHTQPGDEIITEATSHIYVYEGGGYAALSGCSIALVPGPRGLMKPADVEQAIRKADGSLSHFPNGSLVCVENTSNRGGGTVYPQEDLDAIAMMAHSHNCAAHLDGARLFNACVASDTTPARAVHEYDTVSVCLSKGLGAPVGSLLVGSVPLIARAHRWRKLFGGGMRQAGVLAAAGLHALERHIDRLADDHARARRLAVAVDRMDAYSIDLATVQTNMVYVTTTAGPVSGTIVATLAGQGVDVLALDSNTLRVVTHLHISDADIDRAIAAFEAAAGHD